MDSKVDNFTKHYENIVPDVRIPDAAKSKWAGDSSTLYVKYDGNSGPTSYNWYFKSNYVSDVLFGPEKFFGFQFHVHSGSEHTIDGKRFDLEMHTVHYPKSAKNGIIAAALGIIFDTVNYDESVTDG